MGLDMYLNKVVFVGANYEHRNVQGSISITACDKPIPVKFSRISTIHEQVAYWRKANAIHAWFVKNCQNGVDECQNSDVSADNLKTLLDVCKRVQSDHSLAPQLLPTQSGFFFGGTAYDEWYFEDLDYTINTLTEILAEEDAEDSEYEYHSSW